MSNRPSYSCVRCAERKVKCDRQKPCGACVKHKVNCVFVDARPPAKRQKRVKEQILNDRIQQYEVLLRDQGIDPSRIPNTPASNTSKTPLTDVPAAKEYQSPADSVASFSSRLPEKTQLVHIHGRSQFVENELFDRVVEELPEAEDASLRDATDDDSDSELSGDDFGFILNSRQSRSYVKSRHPLPVHIEQLWQTFIERVDPLTKVVHVPTVRPAIQKAKVNIETIPRSFEALMFAIYTMAITSLTDSECKQIFNESRKVLMSQYVAATKVALLRARFMSTTNLVVLQALIIHLFSVRDIYEPRAVWSLTGVAVRLAQAMGLERDGEFLGLPPFETEMRRRVWWLLKTHDFRSAELCGLAKFRDITPSAEGTKWPIHVNDDQLHPGMIQLPAPASGLADTAFICLRYELMNFASNQVARLRQKGMDPRQFNLRALGSDKTEMDTALSELEELIETKYLRYCDPSQPLDLITMLMARLSMNLIRFLTNHPRRWVSIEETPAAEREFVWRTTLKLLEQHSMAQSDPRLKRFAWQAPFFLQWHTVIHALDTVRANPMMSDAERVWQIIESTYDHNPNLIFDTRMPIHVAVANLCLKAYSAREAGLRSGGVTHPAPKFIIQLRQQCEDAKAKLQARIAKKRRRKRPAPDVHSAGYTGNADRRTHATVTNDNTPESFLLPHTASQAQHVPIPQPRRTVEEDAFWFVNGFDDDQLGNFNDMMGMDMSIAAGQDQASTDSMNQAINWEQWDAWLANSHVMRPIS